MKNSTLTILLIGISCLVLQACASKSIQPTQNDETKGDIKWNKRVANPIAKSYSEILEFEIRLPDNPKTLPNIYRPNSKSRFACSDYVIQNSSLFQLNAPFNIARFSIYPWNIADEFIQQISCADKKGQYFTMRIMLSYCDKKLETLTINGYQLNFNDLFEISDGSVLSNQDKKEIQQVFESGSLKSVLDKILFDIPSSHKRNFLLGCFTTLKPDQDGMEHQKLEANIFKIHTKKHIYPNNDSSGLGVSKKLKFEFYCFSQLTYCINDKKNPSFSSNEIYIFLNNKFYGQVNLLIVEPFYIGRSFTSKERAKFLRQMFHFDKIISESAKHYKIKTKLNKL